jgi:DNA-binding GntR family transcriptional regulator
LSTQTSFEETPRRLSDQVAEYLRSEIYSGRLRPGQRLYEVELCERLNVSRAPLREAILALRTDRLVEVRPHRGAVVTTFEDDDIREVFELRRHVEPLGARNAAERRDPARLEEIDRALKELRFAVQRGDPLTTALAHSELHRSIARASAWPRLAAFVDALCTQMLASHGTGYARRPEETSNLLAEHEPIVEAVSAGRADDAERLMREHFRPVEPMLEAYRNLRESGA